MPIKKNRIHRHELGDHFDLSILILNQNWVLDNKTVAWINCIGNIFTATLPSLDDFQSLNDTLNASANILVTQIKQGLKRKELPQKLTDPKEGLAANGYYALNTIFGSDLVNELQAILGKKRAIYVEIRSDAFVIPWEWLFDKFPQNYESNRYLLTVMRPFWGCKRIISRNKFSTSLEGKNPRLLSRELALPLKIGLIIDESLDFARLEKEWFLSKNDGKKMVVEVLKLDKKDSGWEFIKKVNNFLNNSDIDIFHFACETEINEKPLDSSLRMGKNNLYLLKYFQSTPGVNLNLPIVFLNACSTGVRNPTHTFSFVNQFLNSNASCVIAIESSVHSQVAKNFAQEFYERLLDGFDVGYSLYDARIGIIKTGKNPADVVTLFYSLYGNPHLKITDSIPNIS